MITKQKGTVDIYGNEAKKWMYVSRVIDEVMEKYNYSFIRVPVFESSELFHRGVGETTDIVTKETYDFKDRGDRNLTLRQDHTLKIKCMVIVINQLSFTIICLCIDMKDHKQADFVN